MTNINPINFGFTGNQYIKKNLNEEIVQEQKKNNNGEIGNKKQMSSAEVLGYMANVNADIIPAKAERTIEVSKYVNAQQQARIENFMKAFEADYDEASQVALNEFPDISQETAGKIALAYINATY